MVSLAQVEEELRQAEALLASDFAAASSAAPVPQAVEPATAQERARPTGARRREIIAELWKERPGRGLTSAFAANRAAHATPEAKGLQAPAPMPVPAPAPAPAPAAAVAAPSSASFAATSAVPSAGLSAGGGASNMGRGLASTAPVFAPRSPASASSSRYQDQAARDQLIARLLAERREKLSQTAAPQPSSMMPPPRSDYGTASAGAVLTDRTHAAVNNATGGAGGMFERNAGVLLSPQDGPPAYGRRSAAAPPVQQAWQPAGSSSDARQAVWRTDAGQQRQASAATMPIPAARREPAQQQQQVRQPQQQRRRKNQSQSQGPRRGVGGQSASGAAVRGSRTRVGNRLQARSVAASAGPRAGGAAGTTVKLTRKDVSSVAAELEQKYMEECTFKPKINKSYKSTKAQQPETRQGRLDRLASSRRSTFEQREKRRYERAMQENKECTFKPKISKRAQRQRRRGQGRGGKGRGRGGWGSKYGGRGAESLSERLFHEADTRAALREQTKRQVEEEQLRSHPFRPSMNPASKKILDMSTYRPIHRRIGDLQRTKNENLQRLRMQAEVENEDLSFNPKVNAKSEALLRGRQLRSVTDPSTRLSVEAQSSHVQRRLRSQAEYLNKEEQECTFVPRINQKSKALAGRNAAFREGKDFVERQEILAKQSEERFAVERENIEVVSGEAAQCTFTPAIGNATEVLVHTRPERVNETQAERFERLAHGDAERKAQAQAARQAQYYKQYDFQPKINPISKVLGRPSTVDELVDDPRRRDEQQRLRMEHERQFNEQHTFQPKITTNGVVRAPEHLRLGVNDPKRLVRNIEHYQDDRRQRLEAARDAQELKMMQDCTFTPAVQPKMHVRSGPVVVRGLGRYLELKELAKRQAEEQKQREDKAFGVKAAQRPRQSRLPYTVPKPFNLSAGDDLKRKQRRAKLVKEVRAREMKECTFQPKTMEGANRKLIARILDESSGFGVDSVIMEDEAEEARGYSYVPQRYDGL